MSDDNPSFLLGTLLIFFGNILGAGSKFISRAVLGNYLNTSEYGTIILGLSVFNVLSLVSLLGVHGGIAREIPRTNDRIQVILAGLIVVVPFSILSSLLTVLGSGPISLYLNGSLLLKELIVLFSVAIPLRTVSQTFIGVLRGLESPFGRVLSWDLGYSGTVVLFLILGVLLGINVEKLAYAWIIASVFSLLLSVKFVGNKINDLFTKLNFINLKHDTPLEMSTSLLAISIPLFLSSSVWLFMENLDNFLLGYYLGPAQVGLYDAAFTLGRVFLILTGAVGFLFVPRFSKYHSNDNNWKMQVLYQRSTKWMTFLSLPIFYFLLLYSKQILRFVYGPDYAAGSSVVVLISIGFLIHVFFGITTGALTAINKTTALAAASFAALGVNVILNLLLIPKFGIEGAAIASSFSYTIVNILWIWVLYQNTRIRPFSTRIIIPVFVFLISCATYILMGGNVSQSHILKIIFFTTFIIFYTVTIVIVGISKEEVEYITGALHSHLPYRFFN